MGRIDKFGYTTLRKEIKGVVLAEVICVFECVKGNYQCLEVGLAVSNFQGINEINITLFSNPNNTSGIESFIKFLGENDYEKMKGILLYMKLKITNKGYYQIEKLYFKIKKEELIYDPRVKIKICPEEKYDIFD